MFLGKQLLRGSPLDFRVTPCCGLQPSSGQFNNPLLLPCEFYPTALTPTSAKTEPLSIWKSAFTFGFYCRLSSTFLDHIPEKLFPNRISLIFLIIFLCLLAQGYPMRMCEKLTPLKKKIKRML